MTVGTEIQLRQVHNGILGTKQSKHMIWWPSNRQLLPKSKTVMEDVLMKNHLDAHPNSQESRLNIRRIIK